MRLAPLFVFVAAAALVVAVAARAPAAEVLTDSELAPWTDGQGMVWDIAADGQVQDGSNDCFDGGMRANLPGRGWNTEHQQQTSDGQEYVLSGKAGNVEYTRRIRLDPMRAWVRYLEIIHNPTAKPVPCVLELQTNLGNNAQLFNTDGKPFTGGPLAKGTLGFAAIQQQGQNRPCFLWLVGDGQGAVKPTVSSQGGRTMRVRWTMTVPAKGTITLLHLAAQRTTLNPAQLADALKPVWRRRLVKPLLPPDTTVDNWQLVTEVVGGLPLVDALAEEHGIEDRTADTVILDSGDGARMRGQLAGGPLAVTTRLGAGPVPLTDIAASVAVEGSLRLHLRNGEILVADPATPISGTIELASAEGVRLPVDATRSQAVVLHHDPSDGQAGSAVGFIKLVDGTRLALAGTLPSLPLLTTWGAVDVPFAHISRIIRVREPRPAWRVHLDDGSIITAVPAAATVSLPTVRYGLKPLPLALITGYEQVGAAAGDSDDADEPPATWRGFVLDGDQRLAGGFADAQLGLSVGGVATAVPTARIHTCSREGAALAVHLSDGTTAAGQLAGPVPVSGGALGWKVPGALIKSWADGVVAKTEEKPAAAEETPAEDAETTDDETAPVSAPGLVVPGHLHKRAVPAGAVP